MEGGASIHLLPSRPPCPCHPAAFQPSKPAKPHTVSLSIYPAPTHTRAIHAVLNWPLLDLVRVLWVHDPSARPF